MRCFVVIIVTLASASSARGHPPSAREERARRLAVTPSLSVAGILGPEAPGSSDDDGPFDGGIHFWCGLDLYPREGAAFYAAAGAEIQHLRSTGRWEVAPTVRAGLALTADNRAFNFFLQRIPILKVYGLLGWRLPDDARSGALRLGVGISSVVVLALGGGVPDLLELGVDVGRGEAAYFVRLGWGL